MWTQRWQSYIGLDDMAKNVIMIKLFLSVDIDNYHNKCQIIISFKFKVWFLFLSESRRKQTVNHVWNHGLCAPVCWTRWLFVVWCKENRLQSHLVPYTDFTSHFLGNLSVNVLVVLSLDIKGNVDQQISRYDFITVPEHWLYCCLRSFTVLVWLFFTVKKMFYSVKLCKCVSCRLTLKISCS